ncbi:hypothetical protein Tco_0988113 [Tanacetum coccineum]|uniref:Uncharacterized protein n=1 Tax=Tanacetum coccineum TaxID=301880 RepID=A0ABQ5EQ12_9ASTR
MFVYLFMALLQNTMAEQNVPAQPPTRTDEQIVPRSQWLTIGKRKKKTFHSLASATCSAIYLQQFLEINVVITRRLGFTVVQLDESMVRSKKDFWLVTNPGHNSANVWEDIRHSNYNINNIHRTSDSAVHPLEMMYVLGNLKFVPKGESVEVFGMAIPDPLITEAIQRSSYYPCYLKNAPPPSKKPSKRKLPQKVRKGKPAFQLVDEEDEAQQESIPQREDDDPDLELAKKLSLETPQEKREGEGDDADLERAIKLSLDPAFLPHGRAPVGGVTIRDPVSEATPKLHEVAGERRKAKKETVLLKNDKGSKVKLGISSTVSSGVSIPVSDHVKAHEALVGPDPEPMKEDQTGSDSGNYMSFITEERVIDDKPEVIWFYVFHEKYRMTLSTLGYQFLHDKPTNDDQVKSKVERSFDFHSIPDSSHQTGTSTPPVIPPFTDVTSSKLSLLVTPPPTFKTRGRKYKHHQHLSLKSLHSSPFVNELARLEQKRLSEVKED